MDVRVVSYNVHGRSDDRAALAAVVRGLGPDVVVVQEAPRRLGWRRGTAELAHGWSMYYAAGGGPGLGNLIVTSLRAHVDEVHCVRYPLTPGRHLRGAAMARLTVGRTSFVVAGSHLSTDATERPDQARRLRAAVTEFAGDRPTIIAVDVNDEPGSDTWSILAEGFADAGAADGRPTFSVASPRRRIDAVFAGPGVAVSRYDRPSGPGVSAASDHFPVVVDLAL
jgi:endonuclease/exonuclease/phosphatase family metal-dependent hydrolase